MEINETKIYKYLEGKNNRFYCERIDTVASDVKSVLSRNPVMFSNYTNHDIGHSARVADYMVDLLPLPIENYNDTELVIMLFSAIFHDIGMAVSETENKLKPSEQNEIRKIHHIRSEDYLNTQYNKDDVFKIDNGSSVSFKSLLALLSRSHGESYAWIQKNLSSQKQYGNDTVNPQFISCLLRLSDYLDFDSRRTPDSLFKFLKLSSTSKFEWEKHFSITNFPKIDEHRNIYFTGECEKPEIYLGILNYFASIENEIKEAKELLRVSDEKYLLQIGNTIQNKIEHKTFDSVDLQFSMDYLAISNLLMGENLYNDKKCALREIIQNSLDATLLKKEIYKKNGSEYVPIIKIIFSDDEVIIQDNGIGMNKTNIKKYFLNVGHSFYGSTDFKALKLSYKPISHYGIGFLSAFLLSDTIKIQTSFYQEPTTCNILQLKKNERFIIQKEENNSCPDSGTAIYFDRNMFSKVFENTVVLKNYIEDTFYNTGVKIIISENESELEVFSNDKKLSNSIDISEYLNNVECSFNLYGIKKDEIMLCKILDRGIPIESSDDYLYDSDYFTDQIIDSEQLANWMENTKSTYYINRLLNDNQELQILDIYPLDYDETECFTQAQEILDDNEGAFEYLQKVHSVYNPIRIYISNEYIFYDFEDFEMINMDININGYSETDEFKRSLKSFVEKTNNYDVCSILIRCCHQPVFIDGELFSRIHNKRAITNYHKNHLYIKNVRIPYFNIEIPVILKDLLFTNFKINIFEETCYPDVSRSTLDNEICKKIGYAIGRAIHIFLLKTLNLREDKKQFFKAFINKYYAYDSDNEFCKDLDI